MYIPIGIKAECLKWIEIPGLEYVITYLLIGAVFGRVMNNAVYLYLSQKERKAMQGVYWLCVLFWPIVVIVLLIRCVWLW